MKISVPKGGRMKGLVVVAQNQEKKGKMKNSRKRVNLTKVVHMESQMANPDTPSG